MDAYDYWLTRIEKDIANAAYRCHADVELDVDNICIDEAVDTEEGPARRCRVKILSNPTGFNVAEAWEKNQWWTNLITDMWMIPGQEPQIGFLAGCEPQLTTHKKTAAA